MIQPRVDGHAVATGDLHIRPGGNGAFDAVHENTHVAGSIHGAVRQGVVHLNQQYSAATVDDILGLLGVVMVGQNLAFLHHDQFFRIGAARRAIQQAFADGKKNGAHFCKIIMAESGHIPAPHGFDDGIRFPAAQLPFLHGPVGKHRQRKTCFFQQTFGPVNGRLNFRTFHWQINLRCKILN